LEENGIRCKLVELFGKNELLLAMFSILQQRQYGSKDVWQQYDAAKGKLLC